MLLGWYTLGRLENAMTEAQALHEIATAIERAASNLDLGCTPGEMTDRLAGAVIAAGIHAGNENMPGSKAGQIAAETLRSLKGS